MKQGSASRDGRAGGKVEPRAHAVSPTGVDQLGTAMGNHATGSTKVLGNPATPMYKGRGYEAPKDAGREVHQGGSQRRY